MEPSRSKGKFSFAFAAESYEFFARDFPAANVKNILDRFGTFASNWYGGNNQTPQLLKPRIFQAKNVPFRDATLPKSCQSR
jgi:hypothetical protein